MSEEQLELGLIDEENNEHLLIEDLTLTADKVLVNNTGKFAQVLVIGIEPNGEAHYCSNHGDVAFWLFWLRCCESFIMRNRY
jgi:hypothetical protein